jgi:hypothetical protein
MVHRGFIGSGRQRGCENVNGDKINLICPQHFQLIFDYFGNTLNQIKRFWFREKFWRQKVYSRKTDNIKEVKYTNCDN